MGTLRLDIQDAKYNKKYSIYYKLSILIRMDSLCYIITDKQRTILAIRHYDLNAADDVQLRNALATLFREDPSFKRPFSEILITFGYPSLTFIPNRLYKEAERETYLQDLLPPDPASVAFSDELPYLNAMVVFRLSKSVRELIVQHFPSAHLCHLSKGLVQHYGKLAEFKLGRKVFLNIAPRSAQIYYFDGAEMIFHNSFPFETVSDFIYYVLLIYRQFDLDPEQIPLFYGGMLEESSEIYRVLYRYIRKVEAVAAPSDYAWGEQIRGQVNPLWYVDLLSTVFC